MKGIKNLVTLICMFNKLNTEAEIIAHIYVVYGYTLCCQLCGFVTEKYVDDVMNIAERIADNELKRVKGGGNYGGY